MKTKLLALLFTLLTSHFVMANREIDSLLRVLDQTVENKGAYSKLKEQRIDTLKRQIQEIWDPASKFYAYHRLFKEYRHYQMDSALAVAYARNEIALELKDKKMNNLSQLNIAEILSIMGMYKEALDMVDQIDKRNLDQTEWAYYYHFYHYTYTLMAENSIPQKAKLHYQSRIMQYKDSLLQVLTPQSFGYIQVINGKLVEQGHYQQALQGMMICYEKEKTNPYHLGTLAYGLATIYEKEHNTEQQTKYLVLSAIADLKRAVKSYIALRKLAILLSEQGDVDRAYTYIKCAIEDATFCKARFRTIEISQALPIINAAYDKKIGEERQILLNYFIATIILVLVLLISLIYIYKQLQRLSAARIANDQMYQDLKQLNNKLNELNKRLTESNLVKETYIGSIFTLCTTYINKMEQYRVEIHKKLRAGKVDDVIRRTDSILVTDELKEFFSNFDAIFLNIYPNFVRDFNALLLKEERIIPKAGDILTPELRVFALIKLGITDSTKIASFLHYSPQTVYNHKLKIRNKLAITKEEFLLALHQIGS